MTAKKQHSRSRIKHSTESLYGPVEHGCDAGLRDGDGLLFHGFVDCYPVLVPHLIELRGCDGRMRKVRKNEWSEGLGEGR